MDSLMIALRSPCTRDPSSNRQLINRPISVTTVMDVSQLYRAYVITRGHVRSRRVVKRKVVKRSGSYWRLMTTHVLFEVTVPSKLIVTNWAAERVFTNSNMLIHTGERPFIRSISDYRRDCDLKRHMTCVVMRVWIFLLIRFIIWISTNFDNQYRQSNNQSHVFLIFSACLVSCQCQTRWTITNFW